MGRRLAMVLLLGAITACGNTPELPCPYTGTPQYASSAGCLTVVHGRMLVVESAYGGITPPGGKAREGESAQCAAYRETLEETGLDLRPRQLLKVFDTGFHLYYCEIHAGSGIIEPGILGEIRRGFWLPLEDFDKVHWRFPGQGEQLRDIIQFGN